VEQATAKAMAKAMATATEEADPGGMTARKASAEATQRQGQKQRNGKGNRKSNGRSRSLRNDDQKCRIWKPSPARAAGVGIVATHVSEARSYADGEGWVRGGEGLVDDVEVVEEDDDDQRKEDDADGDAVSHAPLSGGGGKAALLRVVGSFVTAGPASVGRLGHSGLRFSNKHTPIFGSA
jgi:hypothetical protein